MPPPLAVDDFSTVPEDGAPDPATQCGTVNPITALKNIADSNRKTSPIIPDEDRLEVPEDWAHVKLLFVSDFLRIISYDLVLWVFNMVIHTFFRDIRSRGTFNIPRRGPIVLVIAPHHNQFVDPCVVMSIVRQYSNRRIAFLIAAASYRLATVGTIAKLCSPIPVERAQDLLKTVTGEIYIPDLGPENDNLIVEGRGTKFTKELLVRGLVGLPRSLGNAPIESIESDTRLKLRKLFDFKFDKENKTEKDKDRIRMLTEGTPFKAAPHIDNNVVFDNVFNHLNAGKVLGIFPEGGSHDRPDLLPLKPGVAIMALGAAAKSQDPDQIINVIPVGLNYFHPHRFRSRVVIEFGKPIEVNKEHGNAYQEDPKEAVAKLLNRVSLGLKEVTVTCDDYDTLMALQAARRLYTSTRTNRENIPLPMVVEMNRRLIKGYEKYSDHEDVVEMKRLVSEYNKKLLRMGLHDHQIESLTKTNRLKTLAIFLTRLFKVVFFLGLSMPGIILFSPVFITAISISRKKAKQALANSVVKIKAKDVLGSWKILVAMGLAPMLYIFYSVLGTMLIFRLNVLPEGFPTILVFIFCYGWSVLTTYASLRIGEIGMDYYKSLKPLFYSVMSHHLDLIQIEDLKANRRFLAAKVKEFCDTYGPDIFADYEKFYKNYNNVNDTEEFERDTEAEDEGERQYRERLSRASNLNLNNLADVAIFSNASEEDKDGSVEDDSPEERVDEDASKREVGLRLRNAMARKRDESNE